MRRSSVEHEIKHQDWSIVGRLWPYLLQYRWRILIGLSCLVFAKLAVIGIPIILSRLVDTLDGEKTQLLAVPMALLVAYGLLRFATVVFNELRNLVFNKAMLSTMRQIALEVFSHLHRLSLRFHLDRKMGALSRDVERGSRAIQAFLGIFVFNVLPTLIEITIVLVIFATQFTQPFAQVTLVLIAVYSAFTFAVTRWRSAIRRRMNEAESVAHTRVIDSLINYETVKVFGNESLERGRYENALTRWLQATLKNNVSLSMLNVGQGLIVGIGLVVLLWLAAKGVLAEELSIGQFVMVNAFLLQLYIPLNFLGTIYRELNHTLVDMQRMFDILDEKPDVVESADAKPLTIDGGAVRFDNVNFSYDNERPILQDISFNIPAGQTLAVVGPSGAGKSTLSRLLLRFYDPDNGHISIDGQDLSSITLDSLRQHMAIVPQDTVLFNDTLGYNIAYSKEDANEEEIQRATELAQLSEFVQAHPQGYDVVVGERGLKLSGGEKQRVAIARAALKRASLIIFDEATSSLDSRSERAIQDALRNVSKNTTTLVIAHRLSTIAHADQILVLDKGRIVERGTHQVLLDQGGLYHQMWTLQEGQRQLDGVL